MFAYGFLSVVLALHLAQLALGQRLIGLLLSLMLTGDDAISFWITTAADQVGRCKILVVGAVLMLFPVSFVVIDGMALLLVAEIIRVTSPRGYDIGSVPRLSS